LQEKSSGKRFEAVVDTNILFSAIAYEGNERKLLELSGRGDIILTIDEYIRKELEEVLRRKSLKYWLIEDLIILFNINVVSLEYYKREVEIVKAAMKLASDAADMPILAFSMKYLVENPHAYLISGDKNFFRKEVKDVLNGRVHTTRDFLIMIGEY